ncbi:MAG: penicillin-binding protein [Vicinamibacterales bacterium]
MIRLPRPWARDPRKAVPAAKADWRATLNRRIVVTVAVLGVWALGIEARLVYLQVHSHADLLARAERQQMRTRAIPAKRGDILDRRGRVLATSVDVDSIYAVPTEIADPSETVARLCGALGDCTSRERETLVERLGGERYFGYVRRQVSAGEAGRVADLGLSGIGFLKESKRFYPKVELAANLLGFVGVDNKGLGGIESAFDAQIRGKDGTVMVHADARRQAFSRLEQPPTAGATLELTVDEYIQHIAERELRAGVRESRARGGTVVVLDPNTGEILAMASAPTFNPNAYGQSKEAARRNRAVQDIYEPGSTFKIITASAAIEERVMPIETEIDVSGGSIRLGSRVVRDVRDYGHLSFTDVMVRSSNVGAIKIGFQIGPERFSDYVSRFGFGKPISPDFPGESPGIVWDLKDWTDSALMSVSMGYQVGVTPLQMAAATAAIANGGELMEPRVIRALLRDDQRQEVHPRVLRRVVSEGTAAALTAIMEEIVVRGTGRAAAVPGYTVAGKTGTAAKLVGGRYSNTEYNASFTGFAPSRNPAVAILVVVDAPHSGSGYGGATHGGGAIAAPIFQKIAEATLRYLGVPPSINPAPPVLVARPDEQPRLPPEEAALELVSFLSDQPAGTVPDVRGMSARDAMRALAALGLSPRVTGDGFVVSQEPEPGSPLEAGTDALLVLDRDPSAASASAQQ